MSRDLRVEPPTPDRVERLVRSAVHAHEKKLCSAAYSRLSPATRTRLDDLVALPRAGTPGEPTIALNLLKADPGAQAFRGSGERES